VIDKILKHPLYKKHREKWKFMTVGLFNTGVDFALFTLLTVLVGVNPLVSNIVSVGVAMCVSFYLNMTFVWQSAKSIKQTAPSFFAVTIFTGWGVQGAVIWGITSIMGDGDWQSMGAKVVAIAVGMVINFLAYRYIFRSTKPTAPIKK